MVPKWGLDIRHFQDFVIYRASHHNSVHTHISETCLDTIALAHVSSTSSSSPPSPPFFFLCCLTATTSFTFGKVFIPSPPCSWHQVLRETHSWSNFSRSDAEREKKQNRGVNEKHKNKQNKTKKITVQRGNASISARNNWTLTLFYKLLSFVLYF